MSVASCFVAWRLLDARGRAKYAVSLAVCLTIFLLLRKGHTLTFFLWAFLLFAHMPVTLAMVCLERKKKLRVHPIVCFLVMWAGGFATALALGRLMDLVRTAA